MGNSKGVTSERRELRIAEIEQPAFQLQVSFPYYATTRSLSNRRWVDDFPVSLQKSKIQTLQLQFIDSKKRRQRVSLHTITEKPAIGSDHWAKTSGTRPGTEAINALRNTPNGNKSSVEYSRAGERLSISVRVVVDQRSLSTSEGVLR